MSQPPTRRLARDASGISALEFALVAPVLLAVIMGGFDLAYEAYVKSVVSGELIRAGRENSLERAASAPERAIIDERIRRAIQTVVPRARVQTPRRMSFASYTQVRSPAEPDANNNGVCEAGETYQDLNRNGRWDSNSGTEDGSGAKDVLVYTITLDYDRLLPVATIVGMSPVVHMAVSTNVRIQPYDIHSAAPIRNCA